MKWKKLNECVEMLEKPCLGKVGVKKGNLFMALCVDSSSKNPYRGIVRNVYERKGNENVPGFIDRSKLVLVESDDLLKWKIVKDLEIPNLDNIILSLDSEKKFIGLEDPDILTDSKGVKHVYFTIPFLHHRKGKPFWDMYLGHASGDNLENLTMGKPVLRPKSKIDGFKELCPTLNNFENSFHLVESNHYEDKYFSAISVVKAKDFSSEWEYSHIALNPLKSKFSWCSGHVSPCRLIQTDLKDDLRLLIFNGRNKSKFINGVKTYGDFLPGFALYNPRTGKVPWISPEPLFKDPNSTGITFASDFVQTSNSEGILYAHVNDSFIRAYKLNLRELKKLLPKN